MENKQVYNVAKNSRRFWAYTLDSLVASACSLIVWMEALIYQKNTATMGFSLRLIVAFFIVYFFYHWLFVYFFGATPGKMILGLKIVSKNQQSSGDPAGLGLFQSFLRVLADQLSIFFGHGLRFLVLMRLDRTHVSDWVAETQVVQTVPRKDAVKRHLFWALLLCCWFSSIGFMKIYSQVQSLTVVGDRLFFQPTDEP